MKKMREKKRFSRQMKQRHKGIAKQKDSSFSAKRLESPEKMM